MTYALFKRITPASSIAIVEIRGNVSSPLRGFDRRAEQLINGTIEDANYSSARVSRYSLVYSGSVTVDGVKELLDQIARNDHEIIVALGAEATKRLCNTKKTLEKYAGSLTWHKYLKAWVLPTFHPSVVYIGDKKTLNARYDTFDIIYDHLRRAVKLATGAQKFPPKNGFTAPKTWVGHDGKLLEDKTWSGYYEATEAETNQAQGIFTSWLDLLDCSRVGQGEASGPLHFAIDTESRNTNVFRDKAFLMLQVYDGETSYAFNAGVLHHPQVEPLVKLFLIHGQARFRLWNTKYDRQVIWHEFGISLEDRDVDGMVLAMGTTEKGRQCGLKYRSRQDLNAPFYEEALDEYLEKDNIDYSMIPPSKLADYGCDDVYYTFHEIPILVKRCQEEGTLKLVTDLLMPAQRTLADVEYQGMRIDLAYAIETSAAWAPRIENAIRKVQDYARDVGFPAPDSGIGEVYREVCECVPVRGRFHLEGARVLSYAKRLREAKVDVSDCELCRNRRYISRLDVTLNVNSPKQMQHLCYDILKMKKLPYEDDLTTNKYFWEFNANHELAKLVSEYKELQFLRRNFLEGMQRFVAEDGKVHPDFLLFGTKTGRLSVHDPAAQTFPAHSSNGKVVKKTIIADPGCLIVNADYKSLEMFMAHHLTGDPKLLENLLGEWDIHTALAAVVYSKNPADISPEERQSVKSVNFGAGYGISGFKLALDPAMEQATGGDPEVAQQFIDAFWNMYSVWSRKCDEWRTQAHELQYLTTEMGRKRRWNLITKDNANKVNNQAINFAGQSMASDLCLSSLVRLHRKLQDRGWGRVLLTVHDSLVFNVRRENIHEAVELIVTEMTTPPFETETPFAVDVEVGYNYGEKEPYNLVRVW